VQIFSKTGYATDLKAKSVTVNFSFKPACATSQITSAMTYSDYIVSKEGELEFDVNAASYSHT